MTESDQPLFDIIFRGDILPGHQLPEVKGNLAKLFKADLAKINSLFQGAAVPLKRNVDEATAAKYAKVLRQAGAEVQVAAAGSVRTPAARARPAAAEAKVSVQQPLARDPQREPASGQPEPIMQRPQAELNSSGSLSLAPVGADLQETADKPALELDLSQYSLRPQEGRLVDASEQSSPEAVVVEVEDFGLSDIGQELLTAEEKSRPVSVAVVVPEVELAPVGSDMGQIKPSAPPPPPDTSRLSLADD